MEGQPLLGHANEEDSPSCPSLCCPGDRSSLLFKYLCIDPEVDVEQGTQHPASLRDRSLPSCAAQDEAGAALRVQPEPSQRAIRLTPLSRRLILLSRRSGWLLVLLPLTIAVELCALSLLAVVGCFVLLLDAFSYCGTNFSAR
eukprot:Opistho-1_new@39586